LGFEIRESQLGADVGKSKAEVTNCHSVNPVPPSIVTKILRAIPNTNGMEERVISCWGLRRYPFWAGSCGASRRLPVFYYGQPARVVAICRRFTVKQHCQSSVAQYGPSTFTTHRPAFPITALAPSFFSLPGTVVPAQVGRPLMWGVRFSTIKFHWESNQFQGPKTTPYVGRWHKRFFLST